MGRKIGFNPRAEDIDDYSEQDTFELGDAEGLSINYQQAYLEAVGTVEALQNRVEALLRTIEYLVLTEVPEQNN